MDSYFFDYKTSASKNLNVNKVKVSDWNDDENMSGLIFGENKSFAMLLRNLMESVKECQNVYGKNKTLLATEKDIRFGFAIRKIPDRKR